MKIFPSNTPDLIPETSIVKKKTPLISVFASLAFSFCVAPSYAEIFLKSTQSIKGSAGIVTLPDGKLLTASSPKVIRIFNPSTEKYEGVAFTFPDVSSLPDDLAVIPADPSRNIVGGFAAPSFLDGRVYTVLNNGTVIQSNLESLILSPETGVYQAMFSPSLFGANPIAYRSSNDRLYVAGFDPYNLYKLDWRGSVPTPVMLLPFLPEGRSLNGFQFGPDDKLYAPDVGHGEVIKIDVDTGEVTTLVSGIDTPIAVKVDSQGVVYFLGRKTGNVYKYNPALPQDQRLSTLATLEPGLDNLTLKLNENKLFVTSDQNKIYQVNVQTGNVKKVFNSPVGQIWDIDYIPNENTVYVADFSSIKKFNANTGELKSKIIFSDINSGVSQTGAQASSMSVEKGNNGKIVVTDVTQGYIVVLNRDDLSVYDTTLTPDKTGLFFKQPLSAVRVVSNTGEYYLATNTVDGTIVKIYHSDGTISPDNIVTETFATGLNAPVKLKVKDGYVYVVELGQVVQGVPNTGKISKISLTNPADKTVLVSNLNKPNGLDIKGNKMYFVEAGSKKLRTASTIVPSTPPVVKNNLDLQQDVIVSQVNPVAEVNPPSSVAVGKEGEILYVVETGPNAIRTVDND